MRGINKIIDYMFDHPLWTIDEGDILSERGSSCLFGILKFY